MCIRYLSAYCGQWSQYCQQSMESDPAEQSAVALLSYPRNHFEMFQSIKDMQVQLADVVQSLQEICMGICVLSEWQLKDKHDNLRHAKCCWTAIDCDFDKTKMFNAFYAAGTQLAVTTNSLESKIWIQNNVGKLEIRSWRKQDKTPMLFNRNKWA